MKSIKVDLILEPSHDPRIMVGGLARLTKVKKHFEFSSIEAGSHIIDCLTATGHTNLLEPLQFGVIVHGASRVFLTQITRHRQASYVSQSQQYQDHNCFPYIVLPDLECNNDLALAYHEFMTASERLYRLMKASGIPKDQARYVIPGAARNDLFINANAREWLEVIFPQRLCKRNTLETRHIMSMILNLLMTEYGYLFKHTGPSCVRVGECDQGHLSCKNPYKAFTELTDTENLSRPSCT